MFKVGDKVLLVGPSNIGVQFYDPGKTTATIQKIGGSGTYCCRFQTNDGGKILQLYFYHESLEYLKIADTKITRKLYPDWEPDGKGRLKYVPRK